MEPDLHEQLNQAKSTEHAARLERARIANERTMNTLTAPRETNPRVRNVVAPHVKVSTSDLPIQRVHLVAQEPSEDGETPVKVVRVVRAEPQLTPVIQVRLAPSVQLRTMETLIETVRFDTSPHQTFLAAVDRAFSLVSKNGRDIVVYFDRKIAAVVVTNSDGRVEVTQIIDQLEGEEA